MEQVIRSLEEPAEQCFYWGTHGGAELDLLMFHNGKRLGFEVKYADAPSITKSMKIAREDLKLDHLAIVFPGKHIFPMDEKITAYGLESIIDGSFNNAIKKI